MGTHPRGGGSRIFPALALFGVSVLGGSALSLLLPPSSEATRAHPAPPTGSPVAPAPERLAAAPTPTTTPAPAAGADRREKLVPDPPRVPVAWVDPASVGRPYGDTVEGVLTFRGNPTRTYYGRGPAPADPEVVWRYPPSGALCGPSTVAGETRTWCGTGWTGQPAVFERDGHTWLVVGAYDHRVHFLDAATGDPLLPPFQTGDLVKGSVTVDPDGYPLVYVGSRDAHYRVLAFDGDEPVELWSLWAYDVSPVVWNNDWDGAGLVLDDHLFIGGENSHFHVVRLHRGYDDQGRVTVDPELVFHAPGWDDTLLADLGDRNVSIEGSVTIIGSTVYFANSGGLVQGWDLSGLAEGRNPERVFRFWTGDDTDATVVADAEGFLYVASEWERHTARAREVGQLMKLDPTRPDEPLVWAVHDRGAQLAGFWATPALHRDLVIAPTHGGEVLGVDRATGEVRWSLQLQGPTWQSPVVVDDVLIQGDCSGTLRAFDVSDTHVEPPLLWAVAIGGCIESTPAVWDGGVYVGTRAGWIVKVADG